MIPHPGARLALERAHGDRARARELIREAIMTGAREQADMAARSLKCQRGKYYNTADHECRNDGSNCICECHDREPGPLHERVLDDDERRGH